MAEMNEENRERERERERERGREREREREKLVQQKKPFSLLTRPNIRGSTKICLTHKSGGNGTIYVVVKFLAEFSNKC